MQCAAAPADSSAAQQPAGDTAPEPAAIARKPAILTDRPWKAPRHLAAGQAVTTQRLTAFFVVLFWLASMAGAGLLRGPALLGASPQPDSPHQRTALSQPAAVPAAPAPARPAAIAPAPAPPAPAPAPPAPAPPVDEASALAGVIEQSERVIHDPAATPTHLEQAARLQQLAYRTLAEHPDLQTTVLPLLGPQARASAGTAVQAATALRAVVSVQRQLPDWRIVPPAPVDQLLAYYREAESTFGIPWEYLAAIHLVETRMGRIRGASASGAQGPMQFLPATWQRYGEGDINGDHDAILAAARMLTAHGAPADMAHALYRYNPSQQYVKAITAYAQQMAADERAFLGFYNWQVLYKHIDGTVLLPVGYPSATPQPVDGAWPAGPRR
ncbi:MAG: lytic transglycosylase domain-containing protein [Egibacteraceae bacterium]